MAMQTTIERVDGRVPITVMSLDGELDASNFLRLIDDVRRLYDVGRPAPAPRPRRAAFIASSGLVSLYIDRADDAGRGAAGSRVRLGRDAQIGRAVEDGGVQRAVQLCSLQPAVDEVIERTGLDRLFPIHPDRATAIAAF